MTLDQIATDDGFALIVLQKASLPFEDVGAAEI